jgi:hypothetical protein
VAAKTQHLNLSSYFFPIVIDIIFKEQIMQSIDHKGLCVKCDNVGLLGAIGYIYLDNLDFKVCILCVLEILFISSAIMTQGNS